tara:strand:- start:105 stop:398 length:294 start_codon:yes stop_codon:yes gene_type:complete
MWTIAIPMFACMVATGLIFSNATVMAFTPFRHLAGTAGSLFGCLQITGTFITTWAISGLIQHNQTPLASVFLVLSIIACITTFGIARLPVRTPKEPS